MHSTISPVQAAYLHAHRAIVADLEQRLGRAASYQECVNAVELVDAHYRAVFAVAFRRAGIPYRP